MLDALKLMRIPFSIFLMPVYWFALMALPTIEPITALHVFIIIHVFVYPASNGYNSYFDKDEKSIGGLKKPPPVNRSLFHLVVLFDLFAIIYSYWINPLFSLLVLIYLLVSKAYSYDKIRLKKYPIVSTLVVTIFQGFFMFGSIQYGILQSWVLIIDTGNIGLALCSSLFLLGSYPLTQVYQYEEDSKRGDLTLSLLLGIKGTFLFSLIAFLAGSILLFIIFIEQDRVNEIYWFLGFSLPIIAYFTYWYLLILKDDKNANFEHSMKMNVISSLCLSIAFIAMILN